MMKQYSGLILALCCLVTSTWAWGGLFNRFNPSLMNDMYGGSYGKELFRAAESRPGAQMNNLAEILEEELEAEAQDPCNGKTCTANEHCCDGHVCVDTDETLGTCLPVYGKKQGEHCSRDTDCESGFLCMDSGSGRTCQTPIPGDKGLGEDCSTSSDCNVSKGLCCKLHRRAKSQPKKICSYFTDPMMCIGPVATNQVMTSPEHTAGEKRLSGHPDDFLRMK
jgi:hypothetical protein